MFELYDDMVKYTQSLCKTDSEKERLENAWGVEEAKRYVDIIRNNDSISSNLFEIPYLKIISSYYYGALMGIYYDRLVQSGLEPKKADKQSMDMLKAYDKYIEALIGKKGTI
jgi:hypothetical protein